MSTHALRMQKLARRVEEMIRKLTHRHELAPIPREWFNLWQAIQKEGLNLFPAMHIWLEDLIPDLGTLRELAHELRVFAQSEREVEKEARRHSWRAKFQEDWRDNRKFTHSFCRGDVPTPPPPSPSAPGRIPHRQHR